RMSTRRANIVTSTVSKEILLGRVVKMTTIGIERLPCAMVRAQLNEFNQYLKTYFARSFDFWAIDKHSLGGLGDTVLIRQLQESQRPSETVSHRIEKVVFKYGHIIDPVTGKRVISGTFSDEMELKKKLVEEIVDEPLQEDALLFEERRALQSKRLRDARKESSV
ncbi:hypothetical protein PENTCL1PPCAC_9472, partial [Pristionchus entomophagus]